MVPKQQITDNLWPQEPYSFTKKWLYSVEDYQKNMEYNQNYIRFIIIVETIITEPVESCLIGPTHSLDYTFPTVPEIYFKSFSSDDFDLDT